MEMLGTSEVLSVGCWTPETLAPQVPICPKCGSKMPRATCAECELKEGVFLNTKQKRAEGHEVWSSQ